MSGQAYRVACHYGETEEELDATMRIASASSFNDLLLFVLKEVGKLTPVRCEEAFLGHGTSASTSRLSSSAI